MQNSDESLIILVVNPGSTSTKSALYHSRVLMHSLTRHHKTSELKQFKNITDQLEFRLSCVKKFLKTFKITHLHAIAARGGLLRPVKGGVYPVNAVMCRELSIMKYGAHASNLGALIADRLAREFGCPSFISDPPVVDEMEDYARLSGIPGMERRSRFHALNQKYVARLIAKRIGMAYEKGNFIVAHMGGGISVGAHCRGRVIDVNDALDGDGPFSPERSGSVPAARLVRLIEDNPESIPAIKRKIAGTGGITAYLGTNDMRKVEKKIAGGDKKAALVREAMAFQISKEIAMHGATLKGKIDGIILTGGLAGDKNLVRLIRNRIGHMSRCYVVPGEREMESLAYNVLEVIRKTKKPGTYP
ncbi:MAG: butyrate kinase [Spirochaetales bacterium]|nr:butyrate kinase [Spirochaetales bacterium]